MNTMAAIVVILLRSGMGPSVPNNDWLEPPNDAPMSAPFPCCNKTMQIKNKQTIVWRTIIKVVI